MKTNQSAPATPVNKKPFILIRWGNLILLLIALFLFLAGFPTPSGASHATPNERAAYGYIYLVCAARILILSIIRIAKKHHRVLSILWILVVPVLLYLTPIFWAPRNNINFAPDITKSESDINSAPGTVSREGENKLGNQNAPSATPTLEPTPTPAPAPTPSPTTRALIYNGSLTLTAQNSFHCSSCGADSPVSKADISLTMIFSDLQAFSDGGQVYSTGNFQYSCSVAGPKPKDNLSDSYSGTLENISIVATYLSGGQSEFNGQEGIYFSLNGPPFKWFQDKCAGRVTDPSGLAEEALGASHNSTDGYRSVGYFAKNLVKTTGDTVNFSGTITKESGDSITNYNGTLQLIPQ